MHTRIAAIAPAAGAFVLLGIAFRTVRAQTTEPPLIPRAVLFDNPERLTPEISPDGRKLAYLAPDGGVLNIWVRTIGQQDDHAVTHDRTRPIYEYYWQGDSKHILHLQDQGGDENWRLFQTDIATGRSRDLTPRDSIRTEIVKIDPDYANQIVVAWNIRDRRYHDAYRLDLESGKPTLVAENPGDVHEWTADNVLRVRLATATLPDGGVELRVRETERSSWRAIRRESADESELVVAGFGQDNRTIWLMSSVEANAARLLRLDGLTGRASPIAADTQFDATTVLIHPKRHTPQAVRFTRQRADWMVLDTAVSGDFAVLQKTHDGDFEITSRSHDDSKWIVTYEVSDGPIAYYLYERATRRATLLFVHRPKLEQYRLAKMEPVSFPARDGRELYGYLTLPVGRDPHNLPLVLFVHGGPWGRDLWGYNRDVQWLANRGYAVLQVNFRGSTGFGKDYLNAGDREWGAKMHTDLLDGKAWAIARGYADAKRVCIYGGSYGGYATLAAVAFTPDEFQCGVDLFGPSNLVSLLQTIPPYWTALQAMFAKRLGKVGRDDDFLRSRSPLTRADSIRTPLMIVQGANDARVKRAESDQIVEAMRKKGKEVLYIVFPDEGHGFMRPENNLAFYAAAEPFFAKYLGGRVEPAAENETVKVSTP
jgi:dipeptidyl aminopeptidase/acylaminoacyl peptidase